MLPAVSVTTKVWQMAEGDSPDVVLGAGGSRC